MALCYLGGAAVMLFALPSSDFLDKAFIGAQALVAGPPPAPPTPAVEGGAAVTTDHPDKTCDGFTLYTTADGCRAALLDMAGNVVHRWQLPFRQAFPRPAHLPAAPGDERVYWARAGLCADGDLLAVYQVDGEAPYGRGLARLDKDSNLRWAFAAATHDDVDVGPDGRIYAVVHRRLPQKPPGLDALTGEAVTDDLVVLSPAGQPLDAVPVLGALLDSPYALVLNAGQAPQPKGTLRRTDTAFALPDGDVLHVTGVKVLDPARAPQFPLFNAGQVLLSLRGRDAVAVVDVERRAVVWAANGLWRGQYDAAFADNGRLLLFDNLGSPRQARVLEYDPLAQAYPWCHVHDSLAPFRAARGGTAQRLPGGNTLFIDPDGGRILEVTAGKQLVWEYSTAADSAPAGPRGSARGRVTGARRYAPGELAFLNGGAHVRP
jgi:hypothetical protein